MRPVRVNSGFTLIELLLVMAIVGLITATAAVRLSGVTHRAKRQRAIDRIAATDSWMRSHATRHGETGQLRFELGSARLIRSLGEDDKTIRTIDLGSGVKLVSFVSTTRKASGGNITVDYSPHGTSETYAVELATSSDDSVWLCFAGVTGQMTQWEDERSVRKILEAVRPPGTHAR